MRKKNKKTKFPISVIARIITGLLILFIAFVGIQKFTSGIMSSNIFIISKIVYPHSLKSTISNELSGIKGMNIFAVNLKKIQARLESHHPEVSYLRIIRQFPNQIRIAAKERIPFVRISIGEKMFVVDREMVVIPRSKASAFMLPVIDGVTVQEDSISVGKRIKDARLNKVPKILDAFREIKDLSSYRIERIDISKLSRISLEISRPLNIIIDQDDIRRQLKMLPLVLSQIKDKREHIEYIDLRFKEPILRRK